MDSLALVVNTLLIMLNGALITLEFAVASMVLGLIVGLVVAIMRISDNLFLSGIARVYVSLMRGTPLLVQIFVVYYGLPSIGISLEPVAAGIFTLTLNTGAYLSESMRGAILGISRGQWAASNSLGFTHVQTLRYVVCPQALRLAVPSLGNTLIGLIKDTSLVSVITVTELLRTTQEAIASSFQPLPLYVAAAAIYWILSTALSWLQERVEKRCALVANH
ncbi:TPA: amino acid ABC transporter permease [Pseudomonas aeruginosa]|nr:amino acid ABC transporter permease [Pseudomonas aeruginosa]